MVEHDEDGFLERWSRRKRGEAVPGAPETETAEAPPEPEKDSDAGDPEVIAKLPDLDSLTEESDFTAFLQDGVPEALRRKALRRLWRLNPVFANLDGLNDYDEDFSAGGIIAENIKTIYKVGKGYLDDDEAETEDEAGNEIADEIAADADAEVVADSEPESAVPKQGDPIESTRVSKLVPASGTGPPDEGDQGAETEKPARGSALARRWGGSPDKG